MKLTRFIFLVVIAAGFLFPSWTYAQDQGTPSNPTPQKTEEKEMPVVSAEDAGIFAGVTEACWESGQCTLCDLLAVFITVANIILRVFAVLATVFFIYGAGYLMLSSGNEEWVSKGKSVMRATIVGSLIVLLAWQIMNFVIILFANQSIFIKDPEQKSVPLSPLGWYQVAEQCKQQ